jgi:protein-disulfide isomerase
MSTDASPSNVSEDAAPSGGEPSTPAGGSRGLLAPAVVLVVVAALAIAAMTGGSSSDGADGTGATDEAAAASPEAAGDPLDDIAEDLVVEPDPQQQEAIAEEQASQEEVRTQLAALATRDPDDPRALGAVDAPVVMIEWADFLCPFCGVFARDTETVLIERYVDTGLLRIEWRDLPFQGDEAFLAALGGQAAAQQDAFWEYHEALFAADLRRTDGRMGRDFLLGVAGDLDLDVAAFEADLDDPALAERVQGEAVLAQSLGITGTPAFIIGGYPLVGAQPLEVFVSVIENAVLEAGAELP